MNALALLVTVIVVTGLSACAMNTPASDVPDVHEVRIEGQAYRLTPLTAATWTASPTGLDATRAVAAAHQPLLLNAIEKASGCKVTDSDASRGGRQLDAQVDCGSKLKN